jgi:hypothetical protein
LEKRVAPVLEYRNKVLAHHAYPRKPIEQLRVELNQAKGLYRDAGVILNEFSMRHLGRRVFFEEPLKADLDDFLRLACLIEEQRPVNTV